MESASNKFLSSLGHKHELSKIWQKYRDCGRAGRSRIFSNRKIRLIERALNTATSTAIDYNVSAKTKIGILKSNLHCKRPLERPIRLPHPNFFDSFFAELLLPTGHTSGTGCFFGWESFCLNTSDGRLRVYHENGKQNQKEIVSTHGKRKTTGVMVWGAISANFKCNLVFTESNLNSEKYISDILKEPSWCPLWLLTTTLTFSSKNTPPCPVSSQTCTFLADSNIQLYFGHLCPPICSQSNISGINNETKSEKISRNPETI